MNLKKMALNFKTYKTYRMSNKTNSERTPRGIQEIVKDFAAAAGNFKAFHKGMNEREKVLFKGWLHQMRQKPTVSA